MQAVSYPHSHSPAVRLSFSLPFFVVRHAIITAQNNIKSQKKICTTKTSTHSRITAHLKSHSRYPSQTLHNFYDGCNFYETSTLPPHICKLS